MRPVPPRRRVPFRTAQVLKEIANNVFRPFSFCVEYYYIYRYIAVTRRTSHEAAQIDQARTEDHGNLLEARRVFRPRDPGSVSRKNAAGLYDGADHRLSPRRQEGSPSG